METTEDVSRIPFGRLGVFILFRNMNYLKGLFNV